MPQPSTRPHALIRPAEPVTTVAPGGAARAAVRPEFIELSASRPDGDANVAEGRVIGVSHLGETMQYLVQLGPDLSVISRRPTPDAPRLSLGATAWCSWRPDAVQVFAADGAASAAGFVEPPTADPQPRA